MIDTYSEEYRHQCEVRAIIDYRIRKGSNWAHTFLDKVEKERGKKARAKLEDDILQQWSLGNRGQPGVWLEPPVA